MNDDGFLAEHAENGGETAENGSSLSENEVGEILIGEAIRVHRRFGPGLFESVYEAALAQQLARRGLEVRRQMLIGVEYEGLALAGAFRADLVIENKVIVELKCVETIHDIHKKQLLTYVRLSGVKLGYLLNFGLPTLKDGITRIANGVDEAEVK